MVMCRFQTYMLFNQFSRYFLVLSIKVQIVNKKNRQQANTNSNSASIHTIQFINIEFTQLTTVSKTCCKMYNAKSQRTLYHNQYIQSTKIDILTGVIGQTAWCWRCFSESGWTRCLGGYWWGRLCQGLRPKRHQTYCNDYPCHYSNLDQFTSITFSYTNQCKQ